MTALGNAAQVIFDPMTLLLMILGVCGGLIVGAIPGLNATMAMALLTPITFILPGNQAFALLCSVYVGGISGGLYSAILLRIPGTSSSIASTFDGFPLARKGLAGKAIGTGLIASFIGGSFSFICLTIAAPLLARFALKFGPHEYFAVSLLGLSTIASVAGKSMIKGLIACLIGLLAATVGLDRVVGVPRFTFGWVELTSGFDVLVILIGFFAIPQILRDIRYSQSISGEVRVERIIPPLKEVLPSWFNFLRSAIIGTWIGLLPGAGGSIASLLAYDQARRASKEPEKFGTGVLDGVIASETANNAVIGGSIIPLLTLGIPGDTPAAVMLAALMIHGLQPGPMLFKTNPDSIYSILLSLYVSNIFMIVIALIGARYIVRVLKVKKNLLLPLIVVMCFVGAYAINQRMFDVWVMIIAGLLGYVMESHGFPVGPAVLGVVLGPIIEVNLRRAIVVSDTGFIEFFTRPISGIVLLLVILNFLWPFIQNRRAQARIGVVKKVVKENVKMLQNRLVGIGFVGLGVLIFYLSSAIPQTSIEATAYGPSFYPRILAVCGAALGVLLIIFPRQGDSIETDTSVENYKGFRTAILLLLAYVVLTPRTGFVITTILYLLLSFYKLGPASRTPVLVKYLVFAFIAAMAIWYIFEKFFMVFLPHGLLF